MDLEKIKQLTIRAVAEEAGSEVLVEAESLLADGGLGLTSLSFMRAIVWLEDALGVELDDAVLMANEFRTVSDVITVVAQSVSII
jgi:acyl carrier protein